MESILSGASVLDASWREHLASEFERPYMLALASFLDAQQAAGVEVFPPATDYFKALELTPLPETRVVILGQDPYHGAGQAHGLSFSVPAGVPVPPSLRNIFKELHAETGVPLPAHGDLSTWAERGVLLLNSVLSVASGEAASHRDRGWESFTDRVIALINERRRGVVFMLWGSHAQRKGALIDRHRHCVLVAPHPSPLSAHRGFFGCGHFLDANNYLCAQGDPPLDWSLPSTPQ